MRRLLVCDLDGTFLGDAASLTTLLELLQLPGAPVLAFATGRQGYSAIEVLAHRHVHLGTYLIAGVGTEMYRRIGKTWLPLASWPQLGSGWDAQLVRKRLAGLSQLRPQHIAVSSPYKLSYIAPVRAVAAVSEALSSAAVDATIVHSHGDMLDVLPRGIDKGSAVLWLARRLGIGLEDIVTCGDTANDLSMLQLNCSSIVVGNCEDELRKLEDALLNTVFAAEPCTAGILEGLRACGWLQDSIWNLPV